jgi:hypothetical protein
LPAATRREGWPSLGDLCGVEECEKYGVDTESTVNVRTPGFSFAACDSAGVLSATMQRLAFECVACRDCP